MSGRNKKGQFGKGNQAARKGKAHIQVLGAHDGLTIPREETEARTIQFRDRWLRFGSDNLFPQALAQLNRKSPTHRAVLTWKTIYTIGKGFTFDEGNQALEEFVNNANGKEPLADVTRKLIQDNYGQGNEYLEIVKDKVARPKFINIFHKDATTARLSRKKETVLLHPDWARVRTSKELLVEIPLYPKFRRIDGKFRSIYHKKTYEPEFKHYGIPEWVGAMDAAAIGYKTNKWNLSRLDNAFKTSGVLTVDGDMSVEEAKEFLKLVESELVGEGKQGKILAIIKKLGGEGTKFTPIETQSEGDWVQLNGMSDQDIITAHNWFRSLSGLADNTGFDTQRILNEYEVARNTVIAHEQEQYLRFYKSLLQDQMGIDAESLAFENQSPISRAALIDANKVTMKKEGRQWLGLPELEDEDERGDEFIDPGSRVNVNINEE